MSDETSRTIASYDRHWAQFASALGGVSLSHELDTFACMLPTGARIVDVGAGPGHYTMALAARGLLAIPVDLSFELLRVARESGLALPVLADLRRLPFARGDLDGVWASASLLHMPKSALPGALHELRRVVRLSGVLYCSMKLGDGEGWVTSAHGGERFFAYYSEAEFDRLLAESSWAIAGGYVGPGRSYPWINRFCRAV